MNKFSDGFSDNSYEDLLNQYAGESLGSKTSKTASEDIKPTPSPKRTAPKPPQKKAEPKITVGYEEPVFNIDIKKKNKPTIDNSLNIDLIAPFEDELDKNHRSAPVIEKRYEPQHAARTVSAPKRKSDTMEFSKQTASKAKNAVSSVKGFARKQLGKADAGVAYYEEKRGSNTPAPKIIIKNNKKVKIDFKALKYLILNSFKTHKKAFLIFGCCFLISIVLSCCALSCINDVLAIGRDSEETVEVVLPNDANTHKAVRALDKAGLIKNTVFCDIFLKFMGFSDENYLPGVYYFTENMGVEKMITRFKTSTTRGAVVSVTIPEGYTIDQIFERLEKNDICTKESLYKTVDAVDFDAEYDFIANLDEVENRYQVLEGYMFPATYEFEQGADPATVIRKFLDTFKSRWTDKYSERAEALSMSVDDIITLASIIEKEGADKTQFTLISSVLHNRINRSGLYPTLECNSTQDYVTNTISKRITNAAELNPYIVNYSTYESAGLPPGPICNPGSAAIESALYPAPSNNYFFCHDKNSKIYLAETLEQHNANEREVKKVNAGG